MFYKGNRPRTCKINDTLPSVQRCGNFHSICSSAVNCGISASSSLPYFSYSIMFYRKISGSGGNAEAYQHKNYSFIYSALLMYFFPPEWALLCSIINECLVKPHHFKLVVLSRGDFAPQQTSCGIWRNLWLSHLDGGGGQVVLLALVDWGRGAALLPTVPDRPSPQVILRAKIPQCWGWEILV